MLPLQPPQVEAGLSPDAPCRRPQRGRWIEA